MVKYSSKEMQDFILFTADGLGTVEGEKHGEYLESSVVQSQPPTSTPDERQPPNCGMIKSHLPYTTFYISAMFMQHCTGRARNT